MEGESHSIFKDSEFSKRFEQIKSVLDELTEDFGIHFTLLMSDLENRESGIFQSTDIPKEVVDQHTEIASRESYLRDQLEHLVESGYNVLLCVEKGVFSSIEAGTHYIMNERLKIDDEWFVRLEGLGKQLFPFKYFKIKRKQPILS